MSNGRQLRPVNPRPACRLAAEAMPTPVEWLWPGRIPFGKLTLVVGDPGVGKSLLMADIAARLSRGLAFPDSPTPVAPAARAPSATAANPGAPPVPEPPNRPHLGRVIIASSDDELDDTIVHRLAAAGADLSLITVLEGVVGPDAARLRQGFSPGAFADARRTPSAAPPQAPPAGVSRPAASAQASAALDAATAASPVPGAVVPGSPAPGAAVLGSPVAGAAAPGSPLPGGASAVFLPDDQCSRPPAADRQPFSLAEHFELLEETVRGTKWLRLVILDALPALLATRTAWHARDFEDITRMMGDDAFSDRFGRQLLTMTPRQVRSVNSVAASLVRLAARRDIAIVGVTHLMRDRGMSRLQRVRAPIAILAAARSVLLVSRDVVDGDRRVLVSLKNTQGSAPGVLPFRVAGSESRIDWEGGQPAGDVRVAAHPEDRDRAADARSVLGEAVTWLAATLSTGPRASSELFREARDAGITAMTLRRAKALLGIRALRDAETWRWLIPRT